VKGDRPLKLDKIVLRAIGRELFEAREGEGAEPIGGLRGALPGALQRLLTGRGRCLVEGAMEPVEHL